MEPRRSGLVSLYSGLRSSAVGKAQPSSPLCAILTRVAARPRGQLARVVHQAAQGAQRPEVSMPKEARDFGHQFNFGMLR